METGLHRLTESGPTLEVDRSKLPATGILGLHRSAQGLLCATSAGFFQPGDPPQKVFSDEVNQFVVDNRLTTYANLPDGNNIVGTINGGLMIFSADGRKLRIIDSRDHPAIGGIQALRVRPDGQIWCATIDGIFRLESSGKITVFQARNGLEGGVGETEVHHDRLYVSSTIGIYQMSPGKARPATFAREAGLKETYTTLHQQADGLLLGRHGGLDYFDGSAVTPIYGVLAKGVYRIIPSRFPAGTFVLSEGDTLVRLAPQDHGGFQRTAIARIPDFAKSLVEDNRGRVWAGTLSLGAFIADPATGVADPVVDPTTGQPLKGDVCLSQNGANLLLFANHRVLLAKPDGTDLKLLLDLPAVEPTTALACNGEPSTLLAFKRNDSSNASSWAQGLGRVTLDESGRASWQELDVPALESIGVPQTLKFTEENGRRILWAGGSEGLLRLDYDALSVMRTPPTPFIRLDTAQSGAAIEPGTVEFPFDGHHLSFVIFTGDATRNRDWLLETRFGQNGVDWSAATNRRAYEFSNLSEGTYRFEVRAINAAGQASEPAAFTFRILPPWYRSNGAYAGYALALALGIWGTIRIRERRILSQKAELETQVQERTAELVKANAAKDEFLAGVSHEIRNPMNGVIGISESLRTSGLDPESRRKFGLLRQCASHLSSLLEDILDISKMQAGVTELEAKPFDLHELVETVAAMAAADSEKYHIPVETAISPGVPRHLLGDPRRIRQILLNFVSNALKFSGRGKVDVTVWCQPAEQPDRTEVIFAISDDGPGISAEEQTRLFKRFERGAAARGGRVPGTGLGLALCKGFAEKMGGRIWLESEPGRGSCFYFSAPFTLADEPADTTPPMATSAVAATRKALVVDDQEYNRIVLVDLLAKLGFSSASSASGDEALAQAAMQEFDLVFLDYDLPGMSGLEVSRGIRALSNRSARAHILATTAFSTPEKRQHCLDAGMNTFLGKPVTLERLRKALADVLPGYSDPAAVPAPSLPPPADGLANLRLLAAKKQVRFEDELALYLSELQVELEQLDEALQRQQAAEAAHYAHRLCGRFSFIYERELEQLLRDIEEHSAREQWAEACRRRSEVETAVAAMRLRLASSSPIAPPA